MSLKEAKRDSWSPRLEVFLVQKILLLGSQEGIFNRPQYFFTWKAKSQWYTIGGGVMGHFEPKKSYKKNRQNLQGFLNYIKSSCIIFCAKMSGYPQIVYCLQEESADFWTKAFELKQVLICPKMSQYPPTVYYWCILTAFL